MFEYTKAALGRLFEHPLLASFFLIAGLLLVGGFALDTVSDNVIAVAFMGAYAALFAGLGAFGYLVLYVVKAVSIVRDRTAAYV